MEHLRILTIGLAFLIALTGVSLSARTASAQATMPTWAKWAFDLSVNGDQIVAQWHVIIGGEDKAGNPLTLHTETLTIPCAVVGEAKAGGGVIKFSGGHLECDFPDLLTTANAIITNLWGKQYILSAGPDCDCAPIKFGYATVDATPAGPGSHPIFNHPNIATSLHFDAGSGIRSEFRFGQESSLSAAVSPSQDPVLTSRYECDKANGTCFFVHLADGAKISEEKRMFVIPQFYTGAVTVPIGYDSTSGEAFSGILRSLTVDPGCRVN